MIKRMLTMKRLGALALICLAGCGPKSCGTADDTRVLLTPEEAEEVRWLEADWLNMDRDRQVSAGPRIVFHEPVPRAGRGEPILEMASPTSFSVSFEANPDPVKMKSLSVRAGKGFIWKDLTPRLQAYVDGNAISAEELKIPQGRFVLKISIDDVNGRTTQSKYRIHVQ